MGEPHIESPPIVANNDDTTNLAQEPKSEDKERAKDKRPPAEATNDDHNGEVVMENDEDTVIY